MHKAEEECHEAFILDGEFLLVHPYSRGQDYAVLGANPNGGPIGEVKSVPGDLDTGFRVGAGYRIPGEGWEIHSVYTYIHSNDKSSVDAGPGESVFPTLTFPGVVTAFQGAVAVSAVDVNILDIELGRRWDVSERVALRVFFGPTFSYIDQKFDATYTGGPFALDNVHRQLTFGGGGLRVGGEATFKIVDHLGLYTRASVSMMTGWFHSNLSEVANGATVVNVSEKFDKVVPVADMGIGLNYQFGKLHLSAGYEFINWFGLIEQISFADDTSPGSYNRRTGDLGFNGIVFRAEWMF